MSELKPYFVSYMKYYIEALTNEREEFFLSLCDIEEEPLQELEPSDFSGYEVIIVDKKDYSEAVRVRNDAGIKRIVLLSGEGVKQIDSLKDFNEYSVLAENRELMWECLEKALRTSLEPKVRAFLEVILRQSEVSLWELLQYLREGMVRRRMVPQKLNENLPRLGIWKSKDRELPGKGKISRMLRNSRYSVIDNCLMRAISNHKIDDPQQERLISGSLSRGNIQKILSGIYYEDADRWLRHEPREDAGQRGKKAVSEELLYDSSYEYKIRENPEQDIMEIEREWLQARQNPEQGAEQEADWDRYFVPKFEIRNNIRGIEQLIARIQDSNLSPSRAEQMTGRLLELMHEFRRAANRVLEASPVCLNAVCERAAGYTQKYFELLSWVLRDEAFRGSDAGSSLAQDIYLLFCRRGESRIRMPYYHPIQIFYYMCRREAFEFILAGQEASETELKNQVLYALEEKLSQQFPIDFIRVDGKRFVLDHTTVQDSYTDFISMENGTAYSAMDFKVVQQQILDYIARHPCLTEITVCLADISELTGLLQTVGRIRALAGKRENHIGRIDFLILSYREEELKRELCQIWERIGMDDRIRFRFARDSYRKESGGYNLEKILQDADLVILADNAMLYTKPRPVANRGDNNQLYNRLAAFQIEEQVSDYFWRGRSDISVIWGTLQQMAVERQEGFWRWRDRELSSELLAFINGRVRADKTKTIVILSSNEHILSEIYKTEYMRAWRKKHNGRTIMLLSFDSGWQREERAEAGRIRYSMREFYDTALDMEDIMEQLLPEVTDVELEISYDKGRYRCRCLGRLEEGMEKETGWEKRCGTWLSWQLQDFLEEENVLTEYFKELWLNQLYAGGGGILTTLMAEQLYGGRCIEFYCESRTGGEGQSTGRAERDCAESVRIHELLQFLSGKTVIDERTVGQFRERYDSGALEEMLSSEEYRNFIEDSIWERMVKMQERIREDENGGKGT